MAAKFEIKKFNGSNFLLWKLKIKAILRKDNCLAAISERSVEFIDDNKWNEIDGNAIANLHLALANRVLSSIEEKKTAKKIWDHLTKLYEVKSLQNKIFLKRKLYTLRVSEFTSVTKHINTLNTIFSQLTLLGHKIEPNERAEVLLQSVPNSYDQLIINLTNNILTDYLVFDDIAVAILEEENRRKNKEDKLANSQQAEALTVMRGRSIERGPSGSHNQGKSKSRSKKSIKYYNYGKKGNVASTSYDGNALCCEAAMTYKGRKRFADVWIMDSEASFHMTSRKEWFHHYETFSREPMYSCNDHALKIVGIGTIKLRMYDGTVHTIQEVRHVEGIKKNLLSLGRLDDLRCKVEIEKGIMKIIRGAFILMKGEKTAANLYMLKGETLQFKGETCTNKAEALVTSSNSSERSAMV
ncbi:hypothetical protein ACOSQ3_009768 [Xanthoceras sorbifolium]